MKKKTKSALTKESEKFFSFHDADLATAQPAPPSPSPVFVQTFTTYSVCEDPIPDLRIRK